MEPYTEEERAEIARLQAEGCSYLEAVMKIRGVGKVEVCIDGESVPLNDIDPFIGQLIIDKSDMLLNSIKASRMKGAFDFVVSLKLLPRRIKIRRPPQPNRRKKKKARRK